MVAPVVNRMEQIAPMFEAAIERGELDPAVDRSELFAFAAGPLYFRTLITAHKVDDAWIDRIVDVVCSRYCINRSGGGGTSLGSTITDPAPHRSSPSPPGR